MDKYGFVGSARDLPSHTVARMYMWGSLWGFGSSLWTLSPLSWDRFQDLRPTCVAGHSIRFTCLMFYASWVVLWCCVSPEKLPLA
jgi:hypothetical protein